MDIEKIKNYNQKLLAVLGSIVAIMVFVGLIMMIVAGISELSRLFRSNTQTGILSEEKIEELQKDNKRQQVISYDSPELLDTLNLIYIIPVRQLTLKSPEQINRNNSPAYDSYNDISFGKKYRNIYGSFNNLLIYDLKNNSTKALFDKRVNFGEIRTDVIEGDILISFVASDSDTYRDGVINLKDLKSLYLYSFSEKRLRSVSVTQKDVIDYDFIYNSKDIMVHFGIDHDKDGQFDGSYEPSVIGKYNFEEDKLTDIVDQETKNKLQGLLEGSVK